MKSNRPAMWFLSATLLLAGCASDPVSPSENDGVPSSAVVSMTTESSGWIGAAGGTLFVSGRTLTVPAGALLQSTYITMRTLSDGSVEVEPDGQTFLIPVQLTLPVPLGGNGANYAVEWYDPSAEQWTVIPSVSLGLGRLASLGHFSIYRLSTVN